MNKPTIGYIAKSYRSYVSMRLQEILEKYGSSMEPEGRNDFTEIMCQSHEPLILLLDRFLRNRQDYAFPNDCKDDIYSLIKSIDGKQTEYFRSKTETHKIYKRFNFPLDHYSNHNVILPSGVTSFFLYANT